MIAMSVLALPRIVLFACAALAASAALCSENQAAIVFANHSRLVMSAPVPESLVGKFGSGWTQLVFVRPDGAAVRLLANDGLTADGGIVFSAPRDEAASADGRYVVIDLTRSGVLETGDGKPTVTGRQYCPIVDTGTGCVVRDETGDICGGKWDAKRSAWLDVVGTGEAQAMSAFRKPTAEAIWAQYSRARADGIKGYLDVVDGLGNLKACDPPNAGNARYYAEIEGALGPATRTVGQTPPRDAGTATRRGQ
jgi:hypothetical protein